MYLKVIRTLALAAALTAVVVPAASAADAPTARISTKVKVERFIVGKDGIKALGYASTDVGKNHRTRHVTLEVKAGRQCSVLSLSIERLDLKLLGLNLTTSAINLDVKGDSNRTLGRLFCRLSRQLSLDGVKKKVTQSTVRSLNSALADRKTMPTVGFSGRITGRQATSAYAPCEVLNLVIGPVHIDLIGLLVDLYGKTKKDPVSAVVTADPNNGILGERFCELAGGPTT
jgi:hypothetical protein